MGGVEAIDALREILLAPLDPVNGSVMRLGGLLQERCVLLEAVYHGLQLVPLGIECLQPALKLLLAHDHIPLRLLGRPEGAVGAVELLPRVVQQPRLHHDFAVQLLGRALGLLLLYLQVRDLLGQRVQAGLHNAVADSSESVVLRVQRLQLRPEVVAGTAQRRRLRGHAAHLCLHALRVLAGDLDTPLQVVHALGAPLDICAEGLDAPICQSQVLDRGRQSGFRGVQLLKVASDPVVGSFNEVLESVDPLIVGLYVV
mmetsp:Transcript_7611/g.21388  ORF Transcript_7611/g.21388 Transcript_7611/m.21388 type:complete len:257 (+) Transcript_7611:663-1433(+)